LSLIQENRPQKIAASPALRSRLISALSSLSTCLVQAMPSSMDLLRAFDADRALTLWLLPAKGTTAPSACPPSLTLSAPFPCGDVMGYFPDPLLPTRCRLQRAPLDFFLIADINSLDTVYQRKLLTFSQKAALCVKLAPVAILALLFSITCDNKQIVYYCQLAGYLNGKTGETFLRRDAPKKYTAKIYTNLQKVSENEQT